MAYCMSPHAAKARRVTDACMYGFGVGREGQRQTNADAAAAAVALVLGREEGQKPPSELLAA